MTFETLRRHGGRLAEAQALFPQAPVPWVDLSTGVNPAPWNGEVEAADDSRLPDPEAIAALEAAAAAMFGVAADHVAAVPGTELALRLLPYVTGARNVGIVSPTYGSHEQAWVAVARVVRRLSHEERDMAGLDAVVRGNPNNPDGAVMGQADMLALAGRMEQQNRWLIVDEAFADATPGGSVAAHARGGLIVLRSFGKFFGRPGLRLGFVVAAPGILAGVRRLVGDWPISTQAIIVGTRAYQDRAWHAATAARLKEDAAQMDQDLKAAGLTIVGGTTLFRLAAHPKAKVCFEKLAEAGVLTRPFTDHPTWLRFGLPRAADRARVKAALASAS
ncbi:MAG: threonine-phosphate decarboxylase CobD [Rhodospirillaceae bacterium]